ncbi:hypothetical protein BD560DRAFT_485799, partial [Blakeslea trispora]
HLFFLKNHHCFLSFIFFLFLFTLFFYFIFFLKLQFRKNNNYLFFLYKKFLTFFFFISYFFLHFFSDIIISFLVKFRENARTFRESNFFFLFCIATHPLVSTVISLQKKNNNFFLNFTFKTFLSFTFSFFFYYFAVISYQ